MRTKKGCQLRERISFLNKSSWGFPFISRLDIVAAPFRRGHDSLFSLPPVLFSRAFLANPRAIGAVCPSSARLARALAAKVPIPGNNGFVLELGAGTGSVTAALLERGIDRNRLVIVERDKLLAKHLKERFPDVAVINGNAVKLCELCNRFDRKVNCVVSSLPLLSLPPATVAALGETLPKLLGQEGFLVQYTYRLTNAPSPLAPYMDRISSQRVWGNIPPAHVEVFRARI